MSPEQLDEIRFALQAAQQNALQLAQILGTALVLSSPSLLRSQQPAITTARVRLLSSLDKAIETIKEETHKCLTSPTQL